MEDRIEIARNPLTAGAFLAGGLMFGFFGVVLFFSQFTIGLPIFMLVLSAPLLVSGVLGVVLHRPLLRATPEGLWFGGGRIVPWSEVKMIYVGSLDVRAHGAMAKTSSIAIDFHRWQTMLKLPPSRWFGRILSVGDIDVSAGTENPNVLVAKLDAMKTRTLARDAG